MKTPQFTVATNFFQSNDYSQFNFFKFNRNIDKNHVNKLAQSMKVRGFRGAIIVIKTSLIDGIERLYILDGQHRFSAAEQLNIDFKFEIVEIKTELALAQYIADVNNSSKGWGTNQFLTVWSDMKIKEYMKLKDVFEKTNIQITPLVMIYSDTADMKVFRKGSMDFKDEAKSDMIVEQIIDLGITLPTKAFCRRAIIKTMKDKRYIHSEMKPLIERYAAITGFSENEVDLKNELFNLLDKSQKVLN